MSAAAPHAALAPAFARWWRGRERDAAGRVAALVEVDTTTPHEGRLFPLVEEWLAAEGFSTRREPVHPDAPAHPAWTPHPASCAGPGRANLRAALDGPAGAPGVLFNCHADVVPPSTRHDRSFRPEVRDGAVYGRGSADTKGNLVMLLEALRFLRDEGSGPARPVWLDVVVEEEIGGNGTLSTVLHGVPAAEVVVLEPTSLRVYRGHRGCVTFSVDVQGRPVHMGADQDGVSAIDAAVELLAELRAMEGEMLAEARADPDFSVWRRPLQVNVGRIGGGEWPGSVPARCTVEGNLGFLPGRTAAEAMRMLGRRLDAFAGRWSAAGHALRFPGLRTDGYLSDPGAPLVSSLLAAARAAGVRQERAPGWLVSCDARLYARLLGLPTVVFGAGNLADAHGDDEHLPLAQLRDGALALALFLASGPGDSFSAFP